MVIEQSRPIAKSPVSSVCMREVSVNWSTTIGRSMPATSHRCRSASGRCFAN